MCECVRVCGTYCKRNSDVECEFCSSPVPRRGNWSEAQKRGKSGKTKRSTGDIIEAKTSQDGIALILLMD